MESTTCPDPISGVPGYFERPAVGSVYELAGRFIFFASNGTNVPGLAEFMAGNYFTLIRPRADLTIDATIRWHLQDFTRDLTGAFQQFEISGGGVGSTDGRTCIFDFENARVVVHGGEPHRIDVLMRRVLELETAEDVQVVNYAISTALRRCDLFELHSGAVLNPHNQRGVFFAGPSGCGKSTLTLQLVDQGWQYLTDDVLFLKPDGQAIKAYPFRRAFAVTHSTVDVSGSRAREVFANADWSNGFKKSFLPHDVFPEAFSPHCDPQAIFFPTITDADQSVVRPLTRSETMIRLIKLCPWSCYDPVTGTRHLAVLSSLAKQSKGFALLSGTDLLHDPARASQLVLEYTNSATDTF